MPPIYGGVGFQEGFQTDIGGYQGSNIDDFTSTANLPTNWYTTTMPLSGIPVGTVFTGDEANRVKSYSENLATSQIPTINKSDQTIIAETYLDFVDNTVSNIGNVTQQAADTAVGGAVDVIESTAVPISAATEPLGEALESFALPLAIIGGVILLTR
tara:strand:+ start:355 stop:825 length:471 start_codon:yes stop_codon:yes gene_type:complete